MTSIEIFLVLFLGGVLLMTGLGFYMASEIAGMNRLLSWMKGQLDSFTARGNGTASKKEKQAIQEILSVCDELRQVSLEEWDFKSQTYSLVEKIAFAFHPDSPVPVEQARLGDILEAVQAANQKVLNIIHLPRIGAVTQFRVAQIFENFNVSSKNKDRQKKSGLWSSLIRPVFLFWQTRVVRSLLIQWMLLVGEASLRIYGSNQKDGDVEAEAILGEWENLQDEPDAPLPENVKQIAESSKNKILYSAAPVSWKKAGRIYLSLACQIARHYHPDSSYPICEARVCGLLKAVSNSLEGIGRLGQKPVLSKLLRIRISQLTRARDLALPLGQNKVLEWAGKFQAGRVAKWSRTLCRTAQKKQPGILLRDVVFSLVKEGGKRWLFLYCHGKVAAETNKLFSRPSNS